MIPKAIIQKALLQYCCMSIQLLGLILIPVVLYLIFWKYYLNKQELQLLVSCLFMLVTLAFDGWITYIGYLVFLGWHCIILFSISKHTYYFDRNKSNHGASKLTLFIFNMEEQEIMLIVYAIAIWIVLRIKYMKSVSFVFNGGTFVSLMNGWNCTLDQYWWINTFWLVFEVFSLFTCKYLINYETDRNNLYRTYLIRFKIIYDLIILVIIIGFLLLVKMNVKSLMQCQNYYDDATLIRLLWFWGFPLTTIHFFLRKHGEFSIESQSEQAQKQNDLQQQLNQQEIDRQHSRISAKTGKNINNVTIT